MNESQRYNQKDNLIPDAIFANHYNFYTVHNFFKKNLTPKTTFAALIIQNGKKYNL